MAILLRNTKGSELTWAEVDNNFSTLLFDVAISGTNLLFYSNNGVNILKRTIDLSSLIVPLLITKNSGAPFATSTINFSGAAKIFTSSWPASMAARRVADLPPCRIFTSFKGSIPLASMAYLVKKSVEEPNRLARFLPILDWGRHYDRSWLRGDLVAGGRQGGHRLYRRQQLHLLG